MSTNRHLVVLSTFFLSLTGCAAGPTDDDTTRTEAITGGPALLVVGNATLNAGDAAVNARLQTLGMTVTVKTAAAATTSDASGKRIVVISSTVASASVTTKFRSVNVPVLLWESALLPSMGMTGPTAGTDFGTLTGQRGLTMVAPGSDPLAAGLSGAQTVVSSSSTFSWGRPASGAVVVADATGSSTRSVLFRYEKGTAMVGLTAPERRVALFLEDTTASVLTTAGQALVDAALRWTAHQETNGNACTTSADCASALCVSGVCCNTTCTGGCQSCVQPGTQGTCVTVPAGTSCIVGAACSNGVATVPICSGSSPTCGVSRNCAPYHCANSSVCATSCATDADCVSGTFCNATGQCVPPAGNGGACTRSGQCSSGLCVSGVCCNTTCTGGCQSCVQPGTQGTCVTVPAGTSCIVGAVCSNGVATVPICSGSSPTCGVSRNCAPYHCANSSVCATSCATDADCVSGTFCNATGQCVPPAGNGGACTRSGQCSSGLCVSGVCCNTTCTGGCQSCVQPGTQGTCVTVPAGTSCIVGAVCSNGVATVPICSGSSPTCGVSRNCAPYLCANSSVCATSCTTDADCVSGTVCNTTGQCVPPASNGGACTRSGQCSSGLCVSGVCCNTTCTGGCQSCVQPGTQGTCVTVPAGTSCIVGAVCSNGVATVPICSGSSPTCGVSRNCAPYLCANSSVCATSCTTDADCVSGTVCNTTGQCVPPAGNGGACTRSGQCSSGLCVSGVCCNTTCTGGCQSCVQPGTQGTCVTVPAGTSCIVGAVCSNGVAIVPICDGSSSTCGVSRNCAPYLCANSSVCATSCTTDSNCAPGKHCSAGLCS